MNHAPKIRRQKWLHLGASEKDRLTRYFAALGDRQLERFESKQDLLASHTHVENLSAIVVDRERQIAELRQHASNLDSIIATLRQHTSNLEQELSTRDIHIGNLSRVVEDRDAEIGRLRHDVANLNANR